MSICKPFKWLAHKRLEAMQLYASQQLVIQAALLSVNINMPGMPAPCGTAAATITLQHAACEHHSAHIMLKQCTDRRTTASGGTWRVRCQRKQQTAAPCRLACTATRYLCLICCTKNAARVAVGASQHLAGPELASCQHWQAGAEQAASLQPGSTQTAAGCCACRQQYKAALAWPKL
jgi:hypothetical protein